MKHNVVAPSVGESITEVRILKWNKKDGDAVRPGDVLLEIETDKATVEVAAESAGALKVIKGDGELVPVGEVLGFVDDAAKGNEAARPGASPAARPAVPTPAAATYGGAASGTAQSGAALVAPGAPTAPVNTWGAVPPPPASFGPVPPSSPASMAMDSMGPAARAHYMSSPTPPAGAVYAGGQVAPTPPRPTTPGAPAPSASQAADRPGDRRVPMTRLRARIAERLVQAQHTAAILTTFNEVDLTRVMEIRNKHKESFKAKNGVALSFMSFFTRAAVMALKQLPGVNASIDGGDVVYHDYYDVGIAVGTERGLVVPVLRNVENMSFLQIEKGIVEMAEKARSGKLSIPEMTGGTFTISNGGTYGSLLSTPILNPPQSGILGMHKIQERPVAVNGKVEVRPMMYLALSYDHRLIDGKEAVTFLVTMRDLLESPEKLGLDFA